MRGFSPIACEKPLPGNEERNFETAASEKPRFTETSKVATVIHCYSRASANANTGAKSGGTNTKSSSTRTNNTKSSTKTKTASITSTNTIQESAAFRWRLLEHRSRSKL